MTERMKPPARRTGGRTLGDARKTAPPPPPPAAELTPEQFAAEQATAQVPSPAVVEPRTQSVEGAVAQEQQAPAQDAPSTTLPASATPPIHQARGVAKAAPAYEQPAQSHVESFSAMQVASAVVPHQTPEVTDTAPLSEGGAPVKPAQGAEMAVHQAFLPPTSGTAFPARGGTPGPQYEQRGGPDTAPSESASWAQGAGRPKDIPEAAVVLNQRIIARESLDASVPAALKLKKRLKRFSLDNELDHLPIGDIVSVALDEWLTIRGF
ncbi:hypothetical protein [Streptomyces sp. NPDC057690]|uniref:hypothetical protein n=1 Tax=Streptomyces sp. NPDC057690 TaxID=3346214 RepID=UPI00369618B2